MYKKYDSSLPLYPGHFLITIFPFTLLVIFSLSHCKLLWCDISILNLPHYSRIKQRHYYYYYSSLALM